MIKMMMFIHHVSNVEFANATRNHYRLARPKNGDVRLVQMK